MNTSSWTAWSAQSGYVPIQTFVLPLGKYIFVTFSIPTFIQTILQKYVGKPSETDSIKSQISSKTSRGKKRTAQKRHHHRHQKRQVNSNFPYRWSTANLSSNNYFYLFLYLYITWLTINNNTPNLKSPKDQNRRAALGRSAMQLLWSFNLVPLQWFLRHLVTVVGLVWKIPSS